MCAKVRIVESARTITKAHPEKEKDTPARARALGSSLHGCHLARSAKFGLFPQSSFYRHRKLTGLIDGLWQPCLSLWWCVCVCVYESAMAKNDLRYSLPWLYETQITAVAFQGDSRSGSQKKIITITHFCFSVERRKKLLCWRKFKFSLDAFGRDWRCQECEQLST